MSKFFKYYVWQAAIPSLAVLVLSWAVMLGVFVGISQLEIERGGYSVFVYNCAQLGNLPFWVLAMGCEGMATALSIARWSAIRIELPIPPQPSTLELQIPIARLVATNIAFLCGITIVFFPLKALMTVIE